MPARKIHICLVGLGVFHPHPACAVEPVNTVTKYTIVSTSNKPRVSATWTGGQPKGRSDLFYMTTTTGETFAVQKDNILSISLGAAQGAPPAGRVDTGRGLPADGPGSLRRSHRSNAAQHRQQQQSGSGGAEAGIDRAETAAAAAAGDEEDSGRRSGQESSPLVTRTSEGGGETQTACAYAKGQDQEDNLRVVTVRTLRAMEGNDVCFSQLMQLPKLISQESDPDNEGKFKFKLNLVDNMSADDHDTQVNRGGPDLLMVDYLKELAEAYHVDPQSLRLTNVMKQAEKKKEHKNRTVIDIPQLQDVEYQDKCCSATKYYLELQGTPVVAKFNIGVDEEVSGSLPKVTLDEVKGDIKILPGGFRSGDQILAVVPFPDDGSQKKKLVRDVPLGVSQGELDKIRKFGKGDADALGGNSRWLFVVLRDTKAKGFESCCPQSCLLMGNCKQCVLKYVARVLQTHVFGLWCYLQPVYQQVSSLDADSVTVKRVKLALKICIPTLMVGVLMFLYWSRFGNQSPDTQPESGASIYLVETVPGANSPGGDPKNPTPIVDGAMLDDSFGQDVSGFPDAVKFRVDFIASESTWGFIEHVVAPGVCLVLGLMMPFWGILSDLEKAGWEGTNGNMRIGTALLIFVGMIGKLIRAKKVASSFPFVPTALSFFLLQELFVCVGSAFFALICGVIGLDFRPSDNFGSVGYVVLICFEVGAKCWIVSNAVDWYQNGWMKSSFFKGMTGRYTKFGGSALLVFFFVLHLFLDSLQQNISAVIGNIAGAVAECLNGGLCLVSFKKCTEVANQCDESMPVKVITRVLLFADWILAFSFTIPALRNRTWLYGQVNFDVRIDKAAAGNVAEDLLLAQLSGRHKLIL